MFNERFNKNNLFTHDGKDLPFMKLSEAVEKFGADDILTVQGMYTHNKSQFGEKGIIITPTVNIDCPEHMIKMIKEVISDPELVAGVNAGKCGLKFRSYEDDHGVTRWSATFVDI